LDILAGTVKGRTSVVKKHGLPIKRLGGGSEANTNHPPKKILLKERTRENRRAGEGGGRLSSVPVPEPLREGYRPAEVVPRCLMIRRMQTGGGKNGGKKGPIAGLTCKETNRIFKLQMYGPVGPKNAWRTKRESLSSERGKGPPPRVVDFEQKT